MNDIWNILQIEPTQDSNAIRRAYARRVRECHPEEDPEGFLKLREAYQAALACAAGSTQTPEEPAGEPDAGWTISAGEEPNPYLDHEATQNFLTLYTGKQRKNGKLWQEYFISPAFLDASRDSRFTALLRDHAVRLEAEYPPPREFLIWLYIAYQITAHKSVYLIDLEHPELGERTKIQFQVSDGGMFDGLEAIFEIAVKGPIHKKPQKNELAVFTSFREYYQLVRLAE
ncbi:MAG: hypothetical protein K2O18_15665, partial [Oscillospiraceae bacterium]|nr:hypothetical protein [Oscillospiraceae bacterium]